MIAMKASGTPSKLLLVADRRPGSSDGRSPEVRRFRLARLRVDDRPPTAIALGKRG
jgi:hypothetical protein